MVETYHAFLGLTPPTGFFEYWHAFQRGKAKPKLKWSPWYKIHLTLFFWPALSLVNLLEMKSKIHSIAGSLSLPQSSINGFHFFLRPEVLYLREISDSILQFHDHLEKKLLSIPNLPTWEQRKTYTPHWTIARKFHTAELAETPAYFHSLDSFSYSGTVTSFCLFFSRNGIYIPFPFIEPPCKEV